MIASGRFLGEDFVKSVASPDQSNPPDAPPAMVTGSHAAHPPRASAPTGRTNATAPPRATSPASRAFRSTYRKLINTWWLLRMS